MESARAGRPEGGMGGGARWGAQLALSAAGALLLLLVDVYFRTAALSFPDRPTPEMGGRGGWTLRLAGGGGLSRACGLLRVRGCGDSVLR